MTRTEFNYIVFEWDEDKNISNKVKHEIGFSDAIKVFFDPSCVVLEDISTMAQEQRYWAIGSAGDNYNVLLVVHTYQDDNLNEIIRIISARKLSTGEVKKYGYR